MEAPRRRARHTKGLKPTSVVRSLKQGSLNVKNPRVSKGAAKKAVETAENVLRILGEKVAKRLTISKKKTVTQQVLAEVIKEEMPCSGLSAKVAYDGVGESKERARRPIAISSAVFAFGKGCPLGKGHNQVKAEARDSLALLAEDYVKNLGNDASRYTLSGSRVTVKTSDLSHVVAQRGVI